MVQVFKMDYALNEVVLPLFDSFIALPVGYIENDDAAVSSSVERVAQALEPLLARSVPNLKWDDFSRPYLDLLLYEICPDGGPMVQARLLVLIRLQKAALSDA